MILIDSQQIDDTVGVMRENINKVSQRGERLDSLQDKTDNLAVSAQGFRRGANRVRKDMWWKDMKMRVCLFIVVIVLLVVIIVPGKQISTNGTLDESMANKRGIQLPCTSANKRHALRQRCYWDHGLLISFQRLFYCHGEHAALCRFPAC